MNPKFQLSCCKTSLKAFHLSTGLRIFRWWSLQHETQSTGSWLLALWIASLSGLSRLQLTACPTPTQSLLWWEEDSADGNMDPILAQTGLVYRGDVDQAARWTAQDEKQLWTLLIEAALKPRRLHDCVWTNHLPGWLPCLQLSLNLKVRSRMAEFYWNKFNKHQNLSEKKKKNQNEECSLCTRLYVYWGERRNEVVKKRI